MMTHRSKKPFECKFENCDKSYCDARSLRRHLENHHHQPPVDGIGTVIAPTVVPPIGHVEEEEEDGTGRIQYAQGSYGNGQTNGGTAQPYFQFDHAYRQQVYFEIHC